MSFKIIANIHMGFKGYSELANECMINTNFLANVLQKEEFGLVTTPGLNILGFSYPKIATDDYNSNVRR